jgi:hypothetical protein
MDDVRKQIAEQEAAGGHDHEGHDKEGHDNCCN